MLMKLAKKLKLTPTSRRIIMANGSSASCRGIVTNCPVGFGSIDVLLKFMVLSNGPYDLVIGQIQTKINMYHQTVKVKKDGVSETLNLEYEPNVGDDTEDDFINDSSTEVDGGEDPDPEDFAGLVFAIEEKGERAVATNDREVVEEKFGNLSDGNREGCKRLFRERGDVIANSFDNVCP